MKRGQRIRFSRPSAGVPSDRFSAEAAGLIVGAVYTVDEAELTRVTLKEAPGIWVSAELFRRRRGRSIDPVVLRRRRQAKQRAEWRKRGLAIPSARLRAIRESARKKACRLARICPRCEVPVKSHVYCFVHRVERAAIVRRWWEKRRQAVAA